jgi:hypothetical protein
VLGQSVDATTVSGRVLVERPGTHTFVALTASGVIPVGSIVDTTNGRVQLTAAAATGRATHSGQFYKGEFKVGQARSGLTSLTLVGGTPCASGATAAKSMGRPRQRELWGSGHGNYRTVGRYASASVLGTKWLTQDTCAGTLIRVSEGEVRVNDFTRHRTVVLHAPQSYLAPK